MRGKRRGLRSRDWNSVALVVACVLGKVQGVWWKYKSGDSPVGDAATQNQQKITDDGFLSKHNGFRIPDYCRDLRSECHRWAAEQGCTADPDYMLPHCPVSCGSCDHRVVYNVTERFGLIEQYSDLIQNAVGRDLGVPQLLMGTSRAPAIQQRVREAREYVQNVVMQDDRYAPARPLCKNHDNQCAHLAVRGDCETDQLYMLNNCAPVCFRCDFLHVESLCPIDPLEKSAWYPGDMNAMFERIVSTPSNQQQFAIEVLSRPESHSNHAPASNDSINGPWVVILDNFLNSTEAETLIQLGADVGYERSTDVSGFGDDGSSTDVVSRSRTSTNAWCNDESCTQHPIVKTVQGRMEQLTGIPTSNSESLQLLRYEPGQYYRTHHDHIDYEMKRRQGVRIMTIFLYLNDVKEGGETDFPRLGLSVQPKQGRALLWPSVYDENPHAKDRRTDHRANAVIAGIKYGANAWLHQRTYDPECNW